MKIKTLRYFKHVLLTLLIGIPVFFAANFLSGNSLKHNRNDLVDNWDNEGPYVFFESDTSLSINCIKGSRENGFFLKSTVENSDTPASISCYYPLDSTSFKVALKTSFKIPKSVYNDGNKIVAISDIESNYKTFRNFLINSKVIDQELNWTFGENHLVLVGDFIDRSYFTTQILWFIYKLEQDAKSKGGKVHYILGNHEIMNMQGNHKYAKSKYDIVASILGKKQFELYDTTSFLGRWLESKNTIELINGVLFTHGGLSPEFSELSTSIENMNSIIRAEYYQTYYPRKNQNRTVEILTSYSTSPYWYRGYFKSDILQETVESGIDIFNAKAVVVGHTVQSKVNKSYNGKVIGIDVKHPQDYYEYFPQRKSEGLLISDGHFYRIFNNGESKEKI